ncbi:MAG: sigma-70 family RNA polymerase sigma factor [Pusillimonas sp.]
MARRASHEPGWLAQYGKLISSWVKRSSTPQNAEDAVQDAALAMLESDSLTIRDQGSYFRRIAFNRTVSIHRGELIRSGPSLDGLPDDAHPMSASTQSLVEARELADAILTALADLSPACQEAFKLRTLEGLSNGQIAERMKVSRNMVERYMMRTTRHLQDVLHKNGGE